MRVIVSSRKISPIQAAFIDYIENASCGFDTAISLTFEKEPTDRKQAVRAFSWFLNKLNDDCYGNNWERRAVHRDDTRLAIIPVLESGFGLKRMHYHCAAVRPKHLHAWQFEQLILDRWEKSYLGGKKYNKIKPIWSKAGWAEYMSGELTLSNADILDDRNMHSY